MKKEVVIRRNRPNYQLIPVTIIPMTDKGMAEFNKIYLSCINNKDLHLIERTPSGGIKKPCKLPAWDCIQTKNSIEITLLYMGEMHRYQFRTELPKDKKAVMSGRYAFKKFYKMCQKWNVDIDSMAVKNGKDIKATIDSPLICLANERYANHTFHNCHHVDFHSSYPAGLAFTHEEFYPMINSIYEKRKDNEYMKAILNFTIGYLQSSYCRYKWAHLSKDAIENNNMRILKLSKAIKEAGGLILLYNTDGFWYTMKEPYHGTGEGDKLGEWHNDHCHCQLRIKSAGAYEYIENDVYTPVVRGRTNLDEVKPRELWEWGDIYQEDCKIVKYHLDKERGLFKIYEKEI